MIERKIETTDDGTPYSDKVVILYEDTTGKKNIAFYCNPDGLYALVHTAMGKMASAGANNKNRLASLIKVAIKGMLIAYGNQLLDELFATKDHPKPGKGVDLIDWYQDIFTRVGISYLMKSDTIFSGKIAQENDGLITIEIDEISTRPISAPNANNAIQTTGANEPVSITE